MSQRHLQCCRFLQLSRVVSTQFWRTRSHPSFWATSATFPFQSHMAFSADSPQLALSGFLASLSFWYDAYPEFCFSEAIHPSHHILAWSWSVFSGSALFHSNQNMWLPHQSPLLSRIWMMVSVVLFHLLLSEFRDSQVSSLIGLPSGDNVTSVPSHWQLAQKLSSRNPHLVSDPRQSPHLGHPRIDHDPCSQTEIPELGKRIRNGRSPSRRHIVFSKYLRTVTVESSCSSLVRTRPWLYPGRPNGRMSVCPRMFTSRVKDLAHNFVEDATRFRRRSDRITPKSSTATVNLVRPLLMVILLRRDRCFSAKWSCCLWWLVQCALEGCDFFVWKKDDLLSLAREGSTYQVTRVLCT